MWSSCPSSPPRPAADTSVSSTAARFAVGSNGRLSASSLCFLWDGREQLQPEAAIAFSALNDHFRTVFGRNMCVDDTYRSLSQQYSTKASQGFLAATPGTSMHGWGLAVDFCRSDSSGSKYQWLAENAPVYGFINPPWAKSVKYEPWHWEYERGVRKYYDITWGS